MDSGNDGASFSEHSDNQFGSILSLDHAPRKEINAGEAPVGHTADDVRVIKHGYLGCQRTRGGVKQWRKCWAVLRPRNLALYKNHEVSPLVGGTTIAKSNDPEPGS